MSVFPTGYSAPSGPRLMTKDFFFFVYLFICIVAYM